jgi:acyl dehydratase
VKNFELMPDVEDAAFAEVSALEGEEIRVEQYNNEASWDCVRHYAYGLGDDNPLFCDPDYGASTPYGDMLAPPTFPFTAFDGAVGRGMPGVQPMYAGTEWRFHRRLRRGERLIASATFGPVVRTTGSQATDMVIQSAICEYRNGEGELIAEATARTFRVPRRGASTGLAYKVRGETQYSNEEMVEIRERASSEFRRGAGSLDGVEVGELLPTVNKGPIGRIDMTAYYMGCPGSPGYKACEVAMKYRRWAHETPDLLPTNYDPSYYAERVLPSIGHQDGAAAVELGMPGAYNNGPQRVGWFSHCVTNWMGDGAFLSSLEVKLRRPEIFGDLIQISGVVTEVSGGDVARIKIDLEAENQLGERTATGVAEVIVDDYGRAA